VTNMTIARKRFGKHRLKARRATNRSESPLIGNGAVNKFSVTSTKQETFPWLRARLYKEPCLSIVESLCCGNVFSEPLPSNKHMRHNVYKSIQNLSTYFLSALRLSNP
jgi:hypothetical protein